MSGYIIAHPATPLSCFTIAGHRLIENWLVRQESDKVQSIFWQAGYTEVDLSFFLFFFFSLFVQLLPPAIASSSNLCSLAAEKPPTVRTQ